jgi:hypothetical protein
VSSGEIVVRRCSVADGAEVMRIEEDRVFMRSEHGQLVEVPLTDRERALLHDAGYRGSMMDTLVVLAAVITRLTVPSSTLS